MATNPLNTAASAFSPTTTGRVSGQEQTLASWAAPYITEMLGKSRALAQMPYQVYRGPLTAGESPLQRQYFSGLGSIGFPSALGKSITDEGIAQGYMNPYLKQVLDPQMQALQRQYDIKKGEIGADAARAGAFGGSRAGLMGQQLNAELMRQQQQTTGRAYGDAYNQAVAQFNAEQDQARQIANMLGGAGAQQRAIEAEGVKADLEEFERQKMFPYRQLEWQQSMLQGMPISATNVALQQDSPFAEVLRGGGGLMDLYEKLMKLSEEKKIPTTPEKPQ